MHRWGGKTAKSSDRARRALLRAAAGIGALGLLGAGVLAGPDVGTIAARHRVACPTAPTRPAHRSSDYALAGHRWDPALPVRWKLVTAGAGPVGARLADWKAAFAQAARWSGLHFDFVGLESAANPTPGPRLIQVVYSPTLDTGAHPSLAADSEQIAERGSVHQVVDATVTMAASLTRGFGPFDAADPAASPEGGLVLHEIGAVLGLDPAATGGPEVMAPIFAAGHDFPRYQVGDANGLYTVGAAAGCAGFPA